MLKTVRDLEWQPCDPPQADSLPGQHVKRPLLFPVCPSRLLLCVACEPQRPTHRPFSLVALGQVLEVEEMPVLEASTLLRAAERAEGLGGRVLTVVFASVSGFLFICECV